MRSALALIGVGALLAGCAGLNPAPTTAQCSASQGQLSAAEIALTTAQATLAALQAAGVGGAVVTGLEAAIPVWRKAQAKLHRQLAPDLARRLAAAAERLNDPGRELMNCN